MSRHKNVDSAIETAAKQREAEMKPTPEVHQSFEAMQRRATNPVETDGTTEVPNSGITAPNDPMRERFEAAERQKDADNKRYLKEHDGKPKV